MGISTACAGTSSVRLGIMGGTFDPIHLGHVCCAEQVKDACHLDSVLFVPAGTPVFKLNQEVTCAADRLAMCRLALASNPDFSLSALEIERGGVTYTVDTLRQLRHTYGPQVELCLILGADAAGGLPYWKDVACVAELATLLLVDRPGSEVTEALIPRLKAVGDFTIETVSATLLDISSTDIRRRVREQKTIRYLVSDSVRDYILDHGLYASEVPNHGEVCS